MGGLFFISMLILACGSILVGQWVDDIAFYVLALCFGLFAIAGAILETKEKD